MFVEHKIIWENRQNVLYLFAQPFDANINFVKGIFEHLHEDVLLDWTNDYLDVYDVLFRGNLIKIVSGQTIICELEYPPYMREIILVAENKVIQFPLIQKIKEEIKYCE